MHEEDIGWCNHLLHAVEHGMCRLWCVWKEGCGVSALSSFESTVHVAKNKL